MRNCAHHINVTSLKIMSSQRITQYLCHGKIIVRKNKYSIMNLWDYYNGKPRNMVWSELHPNITNATSK